MIDPPKLDGFTLQHFHIAMENYVLFVDHLPINDINFRGLS